jgi:beta-glucanase (GH16 family)
MKTIIFLILMLWLSIYNTLGQKCPTSYEWLGGYYPCKTYDQWVLVFEDNFDKSELNSAKWTNHYPWGRNLYCNVPVEIQYYSDNNNFEFENGNLKIIAKQESVFERIVDSVPDNYLLSCPNGTVFGPNKHLFSHTSGMIYSKPKFVYGLFEIRCKIPKISMPRVLGELIWSEYLGLWPAFWLYGSCSQEIDVFEFMSKNGGVSTNYHLQLDCNESDSRRHCPREISRNDMTNDFHTYSLEWNEHFLIWRIDGEIIRMVVKYYNQMGLDISDDIDPLLRSY